MKALPWHASRQKYPKDTPKWPPTSYAQRCGWVRHAGRQGLFSCNRNLPDRRPTLGTFVARQPTQWIMAFRADAFIQRNRDLQPAMRALTVAAGHMNAFRTTRAGHR